MSLAIRSTFLSWTIGTITGLALWYRNVGVDRVIGGFIMVVSLVFLFEYGLVNLGKPDTMITWIMALCAISVVTYGILQKLVLWGDSFIRNLVLIFSIIVGAVMLYQTLTSREVKDDTPYWDWGNAVFFYIYLGVIFLGFVSSAYLTRSWSFVILSFVLFLVPILSPNRENIGYTLFNVLLLIVLLRWILIYFEDEFHENMKENI